MNLTELSSARALADNREELIHRLKSIQARIDAKDIYQVGFTSKGGRYLLACTTNDLPLQLAGFYAEALQFEIKRIEDKLRALGVSDTDFGPTTPIVDTMI